MAGASMKDIKLRIRSMESTKHITKAMEMVAASKLRRAEEAARRTRPYFELMYDTAKDIASQDSELSSAYLLPRETVRSLFVIIAGDRGLAGGYNHNVFKLAYSEIEGKNACVVPIGKKCLEFFRARGVEILTEAYAVAAEVSVGDCFTVAKMLSKGFLAGEFDTVSVVYTNFVSMLSQSPGILHMLPLEYRAKPGDTSCLTLYEPDSFTVFDTIIHEYLGGLIYGALCESVTSEHGARRTAMDAATKNAEEMIGDLSLKYNRARQGAITQEITEIVAGSES